MKLVDKLKSVAREILESIEEHRPPSLEIPKRTLSNAEYYPDVGFLQMGDKTKSRQLNANTIKSYAQTLHMLALAKSAIEGNETITLREAYYVSKNWGDARCREQPESDRVLEDIEALFRVNREQFGFVPEEKGGSVAGGLTVIDRNPDTGRKIKIDCTRFGQGAYSIPVSVEHLEFETDANFVLVVETAGMFQRLNSHAYWKKAGCVLISLGGVPTRACRRFIRLLSDKEHLPVYAFVDGDPYGYANIYRTLTAGSGNALHINPHFCVPNARLLGVTPLDIQQYDLPTHPLDKKDRKRARKAMENDPYFLRHSPWLDAMGLMLEMGQRAEQQAFAKHGLNYVLETYLPEKLERIDTFLP